MEFKWNSVANRSVGEDVGKSEPLPPLVGVQTGQLLGRQPATRRRLRTDWCDPVGRVASPKRKGRQFSSQSGHRPGLWARSLAGGV